jgi:hypothetical protein
MYKGLDGFDPITLSAPAAEHAGEIDFGSRDATLKATFPIPVSRRTT